MSSTDKESIVERIIATGDLMALTPLERTRYYVLTCESIGVNPLTKPFDYLQLGDGTSKKLVLYPNAECAAQLRKIHSLSITITARENDGEVYTVTANAKDSGGREDEATGSVALVKENGEWSTSSSGKSFFKKDGSFTPLAPSERANAMMKAETKAKRRATFSICGLGIADSADSAEVDEDSVKNLTPMIEAESKKNGTQHKQDLFGANEVVQQPNDGAYAFAATEEHPALIIPTVTIPKNMTANQLLQIINGVLPDSYTNVYTMQAVVKSWPKPNDTEAWFNTYRGLYTHAYLAQQVGEVPAVG